MPSDIKLADVMALHKVKPKIGQEPSMKQPLHQLMLVPAMVIGWKFLVKGQKEGDIAIGFVYGDVWV